MNFNLKQENSNSQQSIQPNKVRYQRPGIYDNVKITEILFGKSSVKQTPYIQLKTVNNLDEVGNSSRMYLSNTRAEGKQTTAWTITAKNLINLIISTNNISKQEAENIELVSPSETNPDKMYAQLVNKLSSLLIGKPFRAKFIGEQTKENGIVYASLDRSESMSIPASQSYLKFDESKDVKLFATTATTAEDMPF